MLLGTAGGMGGQDTSWDWGVARLGLGSEPTTPPHVQQSRKWYWVYIGAVGYKEAMLGPHGSEFESGYSLPGSNVLGTWLHTSDPQVPNL